MELDNFAIQIMELAFIGVPYALRNFRRLLRARVLPEHPGTRLVGVSLAPEGDPHSHGPWPHSGALPARVRERLGE